MDMNRIFRDNAVWTFYLNEYLEHLNILKLHPYRLT